MTQFLLNHFAPAHTDAASPDGRARVGLLCGTVGIGANLILFLGKLLAGLALSSVSVIADSFNNLSDAGSSIITLIGFRLSRKPPDAEHPFGHGRAEYIVSLIIAFLILLLGYEFLRTSVTRILHPEPVVFTGLSLVVLAAAVLAKLWLCRFYRTCGRTIRSSALLALSTDSRNDVLVTAATIVSVLVSHFLDIAIDGYVGVFVALVLLYSGWCIAKDAASPLLGKPAKRELAAQIQSALLAYEEILGVHDLIVHDYGSGHVIASIHAELCDTMPLPEAHTIIDRAERAIGRHLGLLLVIHIDPVDVDNPELNRLKAAVQDTLASHAAFANGHAATAHDFRLSRTKTGVRLFLFDLEPPHDCEADRLDALKAELTAVCTAANPSVTCVIRVEYGYIENDSDPD